MAQTEKKTTKRSRRRTDQKPQGTPRYRSFKLEKKIEPDTAALPRIGQLIAEGAKLLSRNWKLTLGITAIYALSYSLFLRAVSGFSVLEARNLLNTLSLGEDELINNLNVSLGVLATSFGFEVGFAGAVGLVATIVASLAFIFAFRRISANKKVTIREAYYFGGEQIVPFSLIAGLVVLQLIPFGFGGILLSAVIESGFLVGFVEHLVFISVWLALALLSAFWLTNSLLTVYAVSLPRMYPFNALMATAELVMHRRWLIFRKMLFIFSFLFFLNVMVILVAVWLWPDGAYYARDFGAILSLPLYHAYMYSLYKRLI